MAVGCFQHRTMPGSDPLTNTSHTSNVSWTMTVTQQADRLRSSVSQPFRFTAFTGGELLGRDLGDTIFVHTTSGSSFWDLASR